MITTTKSQWSFEYFFLPKKTEPKFIYTNQMMIMVCINHINSPIFM